MGDDIDWDAVILICLLLALNIIQALGHPYKFFPH